MITKLLSRDPFAGVTRWFHYDELTEQTTIETVMDDAAATALLENNLAGRNARDKRSPWGDRAHVATIPAHIYGEMLRTGMAKDESAMKRWLNDPANVRYRTRLGRV